MDIQTTVRLTPEEEATLHSILGGNVADLPTKVGELGRAALREYVEMLLGETTLRSPEAREQRLLNIILEARQGQVPTEVEVSRMFGLTISGARSLLRSVLSRHRLRLAGSAKAAGLAILAACGAEQEGVRRVTVGDPAIVEYLNGLLVELNGELKRITKENRTGSTYLVPEDSYVALTARLNQP